MVVKKVRESSPLWVWLAIVLLTLGAVAYAAGVAILEHFMAAAS